MTAHMMTSPEADRLPDADVGIFALWQLTQMSSIYKKAPRDIPHFLEKYGLYMIIVYFTPNYIYYPAVVAEGSIPLALAVMIVRVSRISSIVDFYSRNTVAEFGCIEYRLISFVPSRIWSPLYGSV